jgi:hypothetical protein
MISTSAFALWLFEDVLPWLFRHAELLAPIAIANAVTSAAVYLYFDLSHGGPRQLLLWKGYRWLPVVGAVIGGVTGLLAPFLYIPATEWVFEVDVGPPNLGLDLPVFIYSLMGFPVMVPVGAISGMALQPILQTAMTGVVGVPWPVLALPMLLGVTGLGYWLYATEVVQAGAQYRVVPPELMQDPGLSAVHRFNPQLEIGSQVVAYDEHWARVQEKQFFADGGEVALHGTPVRRELEELVHVSRDENVILFPNKGQLKLQRGYDRLPSFFAPAKDGVSIDDNQVMQMDPSKLRASLIRAQALLLQTDACVAVYAAAADAATADGIDLENSPARKQELLAAAAEAVAAKGRERAHGRQVRGV